MHNILLLPWWTGSLASREIVQSAKKEIETDGIDSNLPDDYDGVLNTTMRMEEVFLMIKFKTIWMSGNKDDTVKRYHLTFVFLFFVVPSVQPSVS